MSAAVVGLAAFFLLTFPMAYVSHLVAMSRRVWFVTLAVLVDLLSFAASRIISARSFALCGRWACTAANLVILSLVIPLIMRILAEHGAIIYDLLAAPFFAFPGGDMGDRVRTKDERKELWVEEVQSLP